MRKWTFSLVAGTAVALFAFASGASATPLGGATKGVASDRSGIELVHHRPGHKMGHRHGRHYGWVRGKHKGWNKHGGKHHHHH